MRQEMVTNKNSIFCEMQMVQIFDVYHIVNACLQDIYSNELAAGRKPSNAGLSSN